MHPCRRGPYLLALTLAVALLLVCPLSAAPRTQIPAIAAICGVRVGYDTMEDLRKAWGEPSARETGGHPHGRWLWYNARTSRMIDADGFDYARGGRVIDDMEYSLERTPMPASWRSIRLSGPRTKWMGCVDLGTTRKAVLAALRKKLPYPFTDGAELRWEARGYFDMHHTTRDYIKTHWTARLSFTRDRLTSIRITAD